MLYPTLSTRYTPFRGRSAFCLDITLIFGLIPGQDTQSGRARKQVTPLLSEKCHPLQLVDYKGASLLTERRPPERYLEAYYLRYHEFKTKSIIILGCYLWMTIDSSTVYNDKMSAS